MLVFKSNQVKANKYYLCYVLGLLLFSSSYLQAQDNSEDSMGRNNKFCYYLQADMQISQIMKNVGMFTTFGANWMFPQHFTIGIQYQKLTSEEALNPFITNTSKDDIILEHQSAGLKLGYILFANKRICFNPELAVNWAMCKYQYPVGSIYHTNFFVAEPALNVLFNLHKNLAAGLGISYRINAGLNLNGLQSKDLNGIAGRVFIRFGKLK